MVRLLLVAIIGLVGRDDDGAVVRVAARSSGLARVPAGSFLMGIDARELAHVKRSCEEAFGADLAEHECGDRDGQANPRFLDAFTGEEPRRVYLRAFQIDRHETTVAEYRECVAEGACDPRPLVSGDLRYVLDALPVVNVTWYDAQQYCAFRGKRLPTEAEWEKAARGWDGRRWPWGQGPRRGGANVGRVEPEELRFPHPLATAGFDVDDSDGAKIMAPPGSFPWGKSPYGVHDMAGNVSEWVADAYSERGYAGLPLVNPEGVETEVSAFRVVRGGSYDQPAFTARTYYRYKGLPDQRSPSRGFRCARDMD